MAEKNEDFNFENGNDKRKLTLSEKKRLINLIEDESDESDEKAKELINKISDVDQNITDTKTSLSFSCEYGRIELVKHLIELGANVNYVDLDDENTPLMNAIETGSLELIQFLVISGADINVTNYSRESALSRSIDYNFVEIFDFLISSTTIDLSQCGGMALISASSNKNIEISRRLLDLGVDVNYKNIEYEWSSLHYACVYDNASMVELLLDNGADENIKNKKGTVAIDLAKSEEIKEFIRNYNSTKYVLK